MNESKATERTYKDFPKALRELMKIRDFSFPKLARETGQKLSTTYIHNLASGKSRPTKENIEVIARGFKVDPSYFKEYREYRAKEKIDSNPEIADLILDEETVKLTSELATLTDKQKKEVASLIKELKARYHTGNNKQ
ncbi:MAG: helix-turn-helix domain-containing protein [Actinobacteria bacterium]|nr:helix-turn-helix domain-containing protein [Actinomycetota bacterium]